MRLNIYIYIYLFFLLTCTNYTQSHCTSSSTPSSLFPQLPLCSLSSTYSPCSFCFQLLYQLQLSIWYHFNFNFLNAQGYFQSLFSCIEKLLAFLSVKNLVLPAAPEAESIWTEKFGFTKIDPDQVCLTCVESMHR